MYVQVLARNIEEKWINLIRSPKNNWRSSEGVLEKTFLYPIEEVYVLEVAITKSRFGITITCHLITPPPGHVILAQYEVTANFFRVLHNTSLPFGEEHIALILRDLLS